MTIPTVRKLLNSKLPAKPFKQVVFRVHNPLWSFSPLSTAGAALTGGRFNPKGLDAFYTACDLMTAYSEVVKPTASGLIEPFTLCSYQVDLPRVLDFSQDDEFFKQNWRILQVKKQQSRGQLLARMVVEENLASGILVPSYTMKSGVNLVIYRWDASQVRLYDPDDRLKKIFGDRFTLE
ncbi:RES family NAD+ phosphorylase [Bowmanella denitrificans]|uniref:RES family NAD+ phosphorylase n=1 Tax=Bowmanella denitrificans TaxID=366582 RepID=UPI000C9B98A1|nr:RES domain-containing protein [Bowmanella denitrificans]